MLARSHGQLAAAAGLTVPASAQLWLARNLMRPVPPPPPFAPWFYAYEHVIRHVRRYASGPEALVP